MSLNSKGWLRTEVTDMRGIGPFSPRQKLIMTIGTSALTMVALITFITHLTTGSSERPFYALCVLAGMIMIIWVRKAPTKGAGR